jgi:hypothetical protein
MFLMVPVTAEAGGSVQDRGPPWTLSISSLATGLWPVGASHLALSALAIGHWRGMPPRAIH